MSEIVYESTGDVGVDNSMLSVKYNLHDALEVLRSGVESNSPEYFWIDAICINQADMKERASQVSIMDQIYNSAEKVIVWVGQEDEFTADAIYAIKTIGSIPKERHSEIQMKDWLLQDSALARVGARPLHWKRWLGMIVFFNRPIFQRIWIAQEVILAKSITLICGNEQLPWENNPVAMVVPGIYGKVMKDNGLQLSRPLMYMEHIRTKADHPSIFRYLLVAFRLSEASDPRDKIYALLSFAWKERPPFSTHPDVLVPDYTISAKTLYIKTTRVMIQSYGNLRILSHVEDQTFRKMQDLPSWVPDFSGSVAPPSLDTRLGRHVYKASKGLEYTADSAGSDEETLRISGFQLSVVKDAADRFPLGVWEEKGGELDDHFIKIFQFAAEISQIQMRTMNSYGPLKSSIYTSCPPHADDIDRSVTRTEILWRTFCGNIVVDGQFPAPSDVEEEFFRWLCFWILARTYVFEEKFSGRLPDLWPLEGQKRWERIFRPIRQLLEQEPDTSIFHIDIFQSQFGEAVIAEDGPANFEWVRGSYSRWWTGVQNHHGGSRRHLQDSDRRYCMGPASGEIGDEIWVIAGMPAPCLLRRIETGKYKFLGEVYIHGLMNGELADHNLLKPVSTITII